jgi:hypothetical protein
MTQSWVEKETRPFESDWDKEWVQRRLQLCELDFILSHLCCRYVKYLIKN